MYSTYPDYTVQNTYELIAWNKNEKSWLLAHLLGTTLKNEQLLYDDWLVNFSNEPLQGLLTCLSFLCTELLRLKYWKHPHCRHFHGHMPWFAKRKGKRGKKSLSRPKSVSASYLILHAAFLHPLRLVAELAQRCHDIAQMSCEHQRGNR